MAVHTTELGGDSEKRGYLIALHPSLTHREYAVGPEGCNGGREAEACDILVAGPTISRLHFKITHDESRGFVLHDLQSTNGVYVNGERITAPRPLQSGDVIGLGASDLRHLRFQPESGINRPWTIELPAQDQWTIGRLTHSDISLPYDTSVSGLHAVVQARKGRLQIKDQRSLNGTWVNGSPVQSAYVEATDAIMVGTTLLRLELLDDGRLRVTLRECGEGIGLECVSLTREIRLGLGGRTLKLLDDVSLAIRPGEFVGLLGPSGAGKSTLLKSLNGYVPPSRGCVVLNDSPLYQCFDMFRNSIGYVPQDDIIHPELTVASCLEYTARLRLPADVDAKQRDELIESTIESLGLAHVRDSQIQNLSGGQRKRVSIGAELITRPSILFLDEPTSGMDPSTEERLMRHFQQMARNGNTVLITTHILYNLDMLDRVVILSRGRLVFFGPPKEAMSFFEIDGAPVSRPTQIFDVLEGEAGEIPEEYASRYKDKKDAIADYYQDKYRKSPLWKTHVADEFSTFAGKLQDVARQDPARSADGQEAERYRKLIENPASRGKSGAGLNLLSPRTLWTLTQRHFAIKLVSPQRALFYLAVPIILALATFSLQTQELPDDAEMAEKRNEIVETLNSGPVPLGDPIKELLAPDGVDDPRPAEDVVFTLKFESVANLPTPMSVLIMFVMMAVFTGTLVACLEISTERPIYQRERKANQKIAEYIGSKLPLLFLLTAIQCAVFLGLCYMKPGLRQFDFAEAYVAMVGLAWASVALGLCLSAVDPTPGQFSVVLAIVAVLPQLVLSGGLGPDYYEGMPAVLRGIANILPARWGLEMLMTSFYDYPDRESMAWIAEFVKDTVGFDFGNSVFFRNTAVLALQACGWLAVCAIFLKRQDRAA